MTRIHCLALLGFASFGPALHADTITLTSVKDNTLYAESGAESNGKGSSFFCGKNGNGQLRRALVQFDVAANIPSGSTITGAQVVLYMDRTNAGAVSIGLRRVLQAWGEANSLAGSGGGGGGAALPNDATWTSAFYTTTLWTTVGGTFAAAASATQTVNQISSYAWGSTSALVGDVQSFLDAPATNFGWILVAGDEVSAPTAKRFASKENSNATLRPRLVVTYTPPSPYVPFCFGDGSGTPCPCANAGLAGNGCANSSHPSGAHLLASGSASLSADTLVIQGSGMSSVGGVLYFQGTGQQAGGAGLAFGDGLFCAGGTIVRLGVKFNVGGASQYPDVGDPSLSVQGLVTTPGTVENYQGWYRDSAVFCTTATFNLTNGVTVTWTP